MQNKKQYYDINNIIITQDLLDEIVAC